MEPFGHGIPRRVKRFSSSQDTRARSSACAKSTTTGSSRGQRTTLCVCGMGEAGSRASVSAVTSLRSRGRSSSRAGVCSRGRRTIRCVRGTWRPVSRSPCSKDTPAPSAAYCRSPTGGFSRGWTTLKAGRIGETRRSGSGMCGRRFVSSPEARRRRTSRGRACCRTVASSSGRAGLVLGTPCLHRNSASGMVGPTPRPSPSRGTLRR